MKASWIVLGVLGAVALVVVGGFASAVGTYNGFVKQSEGITAQSSQVDVAYQLAFRLLPRLENLTQRYLDAEEGIHTQVAALRSGLGGAMNGSVEQKDNYTQQLFNTVLLLAGRAESYPNLKSDQLFRDTMTEVTNAEYRINAEKVRYNDKVRDYNAQRKQCCMPLLVANMFGFGEREYIRFADRPNVSAFPAGEL